MEFGELPDKKLRDTRFRFKLEIDTEAGGFVDDVTFAAADLFSGCPGVGQGIADKVNGLADGSLKLEYVDGDRDCEVVRELRFLNVNTVLETWAADDDLADMRGQLERRILAWLEDALHKLDKVNAATDREYDLEASREGGRCSMTSNYERTMYDSEMNQIWSGDSYKSSYPVHVKMHLIDEAMDDGKCSNIVCVHEIREGAGDKYVAKITPLHDACQALGWKGPVEYVNMKEKYMQAIDRLIGVYEKRGAPAESFLLEKNGDMIYFTADRGGDKMLLGEPDDADIKCVD